MAEDDLISDMIALQGQGAAINDKELAINLIALLVGGNLTTTDLIGNGARLLMLNPGERDKLLADPGLAPAMVEEVLRFEGPIDIAQRIMAEDVNVGDCPVRGTQAVITVLRAANRDPAALIRTTHVHGAADWSRPSLFAPQPHWRQRRPFPPSRRVAPAPAPAAIGIKDIGKAAGAANEMIDVAHGSISLPVCAGNSGRNMAIQMQYPYA